MKSEQFTADIKRLVELPDTSKVEDRDDVLSGKLLIAREGDTLYVLTALVFLTKRGKELQSSSLAGDVKFRNVVAEIERLIERTELTAAWLNDLACGLILWASVAQVAAFPDLLTRLGRALYRTFENNGTEAARELLDTALEASEKADEMSIIQWNNEIVKALPKTGNPSLVKIPIKPFVEAGKGMLSEEAVQRILVLAKGMDKLVLYDSLDDLNKAMR